MLTFRDGDLRAWDGSTGAFKAIVAPAGIEIQAMFSIDASGSAVGVTVYDTAANGASEAHQQVRRIADGAVIDDLHLQPGLGPALWSLDSDRMVVTTEDSSGDTGLGVFDTRARRPLARACAPVGGGPSAFASAAPRLLAWVHGALRVYDIASGDPVGPTLGAGESIDESAISPDGGWVAWSSFIDQSGSAHVTLANAETGDVRTVGTPQNTFPMAVPSSGGQFVAVRDNGADTVTVLDGSTGATLADLPSGRRYGWMYGFSADGSALLFANDGNVQAVDWRTGTVVPWGTPFPPALPPAGQTVPAGGGCGVGWVPYRIFSADGSRAAIGAECSRPWQLGAVPHTDVYDVASASLLQSFPNPETDPPLLSSDGAVLAFGATLWCL
jgi:DNA-binding beta-propeller fold protein YncE